MHQKSTGWNVGKKGISIISFDEGKNGSILRGGVDPGGQLLVLQKGLDRPRAFELFPKGFKGISGV